MPKDYLIDEDEAERTVFVNGLAYETSELGICNFFRTCGEIERINMPKYHNSKRNIGYCHVKFTECNGARNALDMDGEYLDRRYLKIEMARGFKGFSGKSLVPQLIGKTTKRKEIEMIRPFS